MTSPLSGHCRFAIILALTMMAGCLRSEPAPRDVVGPTAKPATESAIRVVPVRPERKTLVRRTEQPGQIEAFEETPLYAKATGFVKRYLVDIGDEITGPKYDARGRIIEEGQVLAELSIPELEAEIAQKHALIAQASAEVEQADAAISVAEAVSDWADAKLRESQAGIDRDEAQYQRWKFELARITELAEQKAISRKVVDETEQQFRAADSSRRESVAKVKSAEAVYAEKAAMVKKSLADRQAAVARLKVAEADEQRLQALFTYATIRAPYDGIVTTRNIDTGHLVQSGGGNGNGKPLFVVVRSDIVRIFVDVPEADAVLTQPNHEAQIRVPGLSSDSFTGKIARTAWVLNAVTRTLRTEIDVENGDGRLRPGMYAYANLKIVERNDVLSLPKSAILKQENQSYCWTIDPSGKVVRTEVTIGIVSGNDVEIVSGLNGDERVIGVNASSFREGQQVEVSAAAKSDNASK